MLEWLHWLPIASCIDFKIATLTYKVVHLKQPPCLAQHLKLKSMHLNTRNNDQRLLQHPSVGTNSYGRRAFRYTAPTVWNKLPYKIRNAPSVIYLGKYWKHYILKLLQDGSALSVRKSITIWLCQIRRFWLERFRICQPLLKSDTRNKSIQNQSFIFIIINSFWYWNFSKLYNFVTFQASNFLLAFTYLEILVLKCTQAYYFWAYKLVWS